MGVMLVKQRVANVEQWQTVFNDPALDAVRRQHGLAVTATYVDVDEPSTVVVVMDMTDLKGARTFAASSVLAEARQRAGAVGAPDGVWLAERQLG